MIEKQAESAAARGGFGAPIANRKNIDLGQIA
jgi:hypothetical protein